LGSGVTGGLLVPDEFIIDPWSVSVAFATQALIAGADFKLNCSVTGIEFSSNIFKIRHSNGVIKSKFVINAAGLYSDRIDNLLGYNNLKITPRRGELIVFDKLSRKLVNHIVLPVPTKMGKGVLVSPTIFGNVMLGPTAVDVQDKDDKSTTESGLEFLKSQGTGQSLVPILLREEITTIYTGLRAASNQSDYLIIARIKIHQLLWN
jgi:glycerol-3-phosphate dehydrogenase